MRMLLRIIATIFAGPFLLIGIVWIGQGFNVTPGSFMTGDIKWAVFGFILVLLGASLVWMLNKPDKG